MDELLSQLPADLDASVLIVFHLSRTSVPEIFIERLKRNTSLRCSVASASEIIRPGRAYIALPDSHLLIKDDRIIIGRGPEENRFRPSIDVLFRSAAVHYGERVIGIVLSGLLNDGTSGMLAIKQCGGHCIVQDPNEAEFPDMPTSVLEVVEVDYSISIKEMGSRIQQIIKENKIIGLKPPANIIAESRLSKMAATAINPIDEFGERTVLDCPDCGGSLWEVKNGRLKHYRCHIGHSYSERDLILKQAETIEQTLWVAVRMMEERKYLFAKMAKDNSARGLEKLSATYQDKALDLDIHIEKLKSLLYTVRKE